MFKVKNLTLDTVHFTLSEIGFFYFASTTLYLLYPGVGFSDKTAFLSIANILVVPYIIFSVYYQWRVIKQWCMLCLMVQGILFLEFSWSTVNFWMTRKYLSFFKEQWVSNLFLFFFILVLIRTVWYGIKPLLTKYKDAELFSSAYKRLQHNPDIFNTLLMQQSKAPDGWDNLGISIGNPGAENVIIKVCNPYCGPCAKAHLELEELLTQNDNVQLKMLFFIRKNTEEEELRVIKHLLAVSAQGDVVRTRQALDDWYLLVAKNYELFATKYSMNCELGRQNDKLEMMGEWCTEAEIAFTPTIFVNGYMLPENYDVKELKHILK